MYRSSPFRSTLNTGCITCLGMCKVCTEAVHSVAICPAKKAQTPKHGPGKKDRNRARGVFQGRRTSRSAGIYIYCLFPPLYNLLVYLSIYLTLSIFYPSINYKSIWCCWVGAKSPLIRHDDLNTWIGHSLASWVMQLIMEPIILF